MNASESSVARLPTAPPAHASAFAVKWKAALAVAVPAALWFLPLRLEPQAQHAIAISLFMILAWATEVMDSRTHRVDRLLPVLGAWRGEVRRGIQRIRR